MRCHRRLVAEWLDYERVESLPFDNPALEVGRRARTPTVADEVLKHGGRLKVGRRSL
jgi:hypothetical protein